MKKFAFIVLLMLLALAVTVLPACKPKDEAETFKAGTEDDAAVEQEDEIAAEAREDAAYESLVKAFADTGTVFGGEFGKIVSGNRVLSAYGKLAGSSTKHTVNISMDGISADLCLLLDANKNEGALTAEFFGMLFGLYLSESKLAVDADMLGSYYIPLDNLLEDLTEFLAKFGVDLNELLEESGLTEEYFASITDMYGNAFNYDDAAMKRLGEKMIAAYAKILDYATVETVEGTVAIGGGNRDCSLIVITVDKDGFFEWFIGICEFLITDPDIAALYGDIYMDMMNEQLGEVLDMLDSADIPDFTAVLTLSVYEGAIVEWKLTVPGEEAYFLFGTKGEDNRLNDIYGEFFDGEDIYSFSMKGNFFGSDIVKSVEIEIVTPDQTMPAFFITWDTGAAKDNFEIGIKNFISFILTFAVDGDRVEISFDPDSNRNLVLLGLDPSEIPFVSLVSEKLAGGIDWPANPRNLFDMDEEDFMSLGMTIMEFGESFEGLFY